MEWTEIGRLVDRSVGSGRNEQQIYQFIYFCIIIMNMINIFIYNLYHYINILKDK